MHKNPIFLSFLPDLFTSLASIAPLEALVLAVTYAAVSVSTQGSVFSQCCLRSYDFVKYLRQHIESSLGSVVEEETKTLTRRDGQHAIGSGHDSLIHTVTRRTRDSAE